MQPQKYLENGNFYIWPKTYAIIKAHHTEPQAFANIIDKDETTVIIKNDAINESNIIEIEENWKIITFAMTLPFGLVGFLAIISQALAKAKISIFAISAYSTDHILVKKDKLQLTISTLQKLGLKLQEKYKNLDEQK